jgi:hypothetical protein
MQCQSCGVNLAPEASFCGNCGSAMGSASTPAPSFQGQVAPVAQQSYQANQMPNQYQTQAPAAQWAPAPPTSGKAIASLILSLFGVSLFAVIFGHIARSEIRNSGGRIAGDGLALAGLIIGWIGLAVTVIVIFWIFALAAAFAV